MPLTAIYVHTDADLALHTGTQRLEACREEDEPARAPFSLDVA